ncbi:MAG: serine/threonine-protein kinase, partial [Lachnospiraceae bacterium]|nr:serine/threonine-protein kinase [Lachnospiraceae bacterium]
FLWPMEMIVPAQGELFGYVMPLRPKNYKSIVDLMKKRVNPSFYTLCRTAFNLTRGYQKLHAMGAKYQDISFGNLFFNPDNGDVLICDNDNVSFDNTKPGGVLGTPGFMAPEIVRGEKRPSKDTDRYSLSVLLFYLFMVNHPLEGKLEASIKCMDMAARVKLYGTDPVFIFDPDNKSNRPVKGIHDNANIYWPLYPEKLRQMFTKAFTIGLNEPSKRITEPEWMTLFANMMSGMLRCSCGAQLFYDENLEAKGAAHICWNCQNAVPVPKKLMIGKNRVLLHQDTKLLHHHVYEDFDMDTVVGSVVQNPKNPSLWGIRNEDKMNWTYQKADGTQIPVEPGRTAGIAKGVKIIFPQTTGEFR